MKPSGLLCRHCRTPCRPTGTWFVRDSFIMHATHSMRNFSYTQRNRARKRGLRGRGRPIFGGTPSIGCCTGFMTKDGNRRASALVAIANAKKTGKRQLDQLQVGGWRSRVPCALLTCASQLNDDLVYESVSEDEYDRVVSSRRRGNCDSFIVDDGHGCVLFCLFT